MGRRIHHVYLSIALFAAGAAVVGFGCGYGSAPAALDPPQDPSLMPAGAEGDTEEIDLAPAPGAPLPNDELDYYRDPVPLPPAEDLDAPRPRDEVPTP